MKRFCKDLKEHATKIINYEKKKKYHELMTKISLIKGKKYVIYAKKDLVLLMIIKSIIKSDIIVTTQENTDQLLKVFVI